MIPREAIASKKKKKLVKSSEALFILYSSWIFIVVLSVSLYWFIPQRTKWFQIRGQIFNLKFLLAYGTVLIVIFFHIFDL